MSGGATETRLERYRAAEGWPVEERLAAMLDNQLAAFFAVRAALPSLAAAVEAASARLDAEAAGRIVYVGCGSSGRLAVQDGVELAPTFSWPDARLAYELAGGDAALTRSVEGAEDDAEAGAQAMVARGVGPADVVLGLAASGTTPYTIGAIRSARAAGALTIALANNKDAPLLAAADHPILLETGPEFLAGSTRMTAGTAQKIALNLLSTQIMSALGRIHEGFMVDMKPANDKLVARSKRIAVALTGASPDAVEDAWRASGGDLKRAVLLLDGASIQRADAALGAARGRLGDARAALREERR